ncbi:hypothetical protein MHYP_G00216820 [Metynnis hypsauchen]
MSSVSSDELMDIQTDTGHDFPAPEQNTEQLSPDVEQSDCASLKFGGSQEPVCDSVHTDDPNHFNSEDRTLEWIKELHNECPAGNLSHAGSVSLPLETEASTSMSGDEAEDLPDGQEPLHSTNPVSQIQFPSNAPIQDSG